MAKLLSKSVLKCASAPGLILLLSFTSVLAQDGQVAYAVDSTRSEVGFELQATAHKVHGHTRAVQGTVRLPLDVATDTLQVAGRIEIAAGDLETGNGRRDRRMRGETLDVQRYPFIRFDLERIAGELNQLRSGNSVAVTLEGKLSIRDVTKEISMKAQMRLHGGELDVHGQYALRFTDYNVPDPSVLFLRVHKDMVATFSIVCIRIGK